MLTLSDGEREEIGRQDPAVREMVDEALKTTPEDLLALHGVMQPAGKDPRDGEEEADLDGVAVRRGDKLVLRLGDRIDPYDRMLDGRTATLERIYTDYDERRLPRRHGGQRPDAGGHARERPLPLLLPRRGGGGSADREPRRIGRMNEHGATTEQTPKTKQVLVAAVGNLWLRDDGFGGEVAKRLQERELPKGVHVFDFGTGGLDLAYEVMRGYDALVLVDISRQGGEPGTLYVMEADEDRSRSDRGRRDDQPACHGPPDGAAVRQGGRRMAGQGRRDRLRAGRGRGDRHRALVRSVEGVVDQAVGLVASRPSARFCERPDARALDRQRDRRDRREARRAAVW